jgi:hypothetical protein
MKNFMQRLGIIFYQKFDVGGFIFQVLKVQNKMTRLFFYIAFPLLFLTVGMYLGNRVDLRDTTLFLAHPVTISFVIFLVKIGFYGAVAATSFLFTYESLIAQNVDIKREIEKKKSAEKYRKINKLQCWRMRNMNLFFRILFYIIVFLFLTQFFEAVAIRAAIESQADKVQVIQSFKTFMLYFTSSFMFISIYVEYRINKLKLKAK